MLNKKIILTSFTASSLILMIIMPFIFALSFQGTYLNIIIWSMICIGAVSFIFVYNKYGANFVISRILISIIGLSLFVLIYAVLSPLFYNWLHRVLSKDFIILLTITIYILYLFLISIPVYFIIYCVEKNKKA